MKKRTESLYNEWSRIDAMRKPGKKLLAGAAISRTRALEDREIKKLESALKKL